MTPRLRALRAPGVVVVSWLVLDQLFTVVAGHQGLLAPFGPVEVAPALLGLAVITLRLGVTFLVLPWAAWRLTRAPAPGPGRDSPGRLEADRPNTPPRSFR